MEGTIRRKPPEDRLDARLPPAACSVEFANTVERAAREDEMSVSLLVRRAVEEYLDRRRRRR